MEQTVIEDIHTAPIVDETELLVFDPSQVADELKDRTPWFRKKDNGKKIIMCHDMKGGYKDDKYLNGTDNPYYYNFYNWAQIDIFIYFSHYLVTIPPTMWINSSHKNGIPVLGTFITEWEAGAKKCRNLFGTEESALYTAQKLADVAECYGFDGWLINIENTLDCCEVSNIKIFLQYLSSTLRDHNPNSYVIWYDAVTVEGKLVWQDSLNDMNYDYFESCHGIFLNYTWKDWHLELARNVSLTGYMIFMLALTYGLEGVLGSLILIRVARRLIVINFLQHCLLLVGFMKLMKMTLVHFWLKMTNFGSYSARLAHLILDQQKCFKLHLTMVLD